MYSFFWVNWLIKRGFVRLFPTLFSTKLTRNFHPFTVLWYYQVPYPKHIKTFPGSRLNFYVDKGFLYEPRSGFYDLSQPILIEIWWNPYTSYSIHNQFDIGYILMSKLSNFWSTFLHITGNLTSERSQILASLNFMALLLYEGRNPQFPCYRI